jgi:hypothetical protein
MDDQDPFTWRHFEAEIILLCMRWYLRYSLSYRDLEAMMRERGCTSTIPRSIAGFSGMLPSWKSDASGISKLPLTPGASMRPT